MASESRQQASTAMEASGYLVFLTFVNTVVVGSWWGGLTPAANDTHGSDVLEAVTFITAARLMLCVAWLPRCIDNMKEDCWSVCSCNRMGPRPRWCRTDMPLVTRVLPVLLAMSSCVAPSIVAFGLYSRACDADIHYGWVLFLMLIAESLLYVGTAAGLAHRGTFQYAPVATESERP
jgi:hypothetical protein